VTVLFLVLVMVFFISPSRLLRGSPCLILFGWWEKTACCLTSSLFTPICIAAAAIAVAIFAMWASFAGLPPRFPALTLPFGAPWFSVLLP
jgi:hypothetical protein